MGEEQKNVVSGIPLSNRLRTITRKVTLREEELQRYVARLEAENKRLTAENELLYRIDAAHPNLGLATTRELLDELKTRIEVDYHLGGGGLDYTTVYGRPEIRVLPPEPPTIENPPTTEPEGRDG